MKIHDVNSGIKKNRRKKRLGRGTGSGLGKTSGRGHKGYFSRSGSSQHPSFQGGAMPMFRRIPKRGFNNRFALKVGIVNVRDLEAKFEAGEEVTMESLKARNLAAYGYDVLKVLGEGEITKGLKVTAHRFSKSAREKIEKAGGECIVLPGKAAIEKNRMGSSKAKTE